jgi:hypothetical protein
MFRYSRINSEFSDTSLSPFTTIGVKRVQQKRLFLNGNYTPVSRHLGNLMSPAAGYRTTKLWSDAIALPLLYCRRCRSAATKANFPDTQIINYTAAAEYLNLM